MNMFSTLKKWYFKLVLVGVGFYDNCWNSHAHIG